MNSSKTVLVGGVFDPLHAGHLAYLQAARQYGRIVCALSDAPSKHPPLVPITQRMELLAAMGVENVILHDGSGVARIIEELTPAFYVKGPDWTDRLPPDELAACARARTEVVYTDTKVESSSQLLADYERARTAEKLADFEAFVTTQAEPVAWAPVTPYDRDSRRQIEGPNADHLAAAFRGCTVLDYGCGFGYLAELLTERGMEVARWDPQFHDDADALSDLYDLVICREVLEHIPMRDWPNTLWTLTQTSKRFIYLTTRFTAKSHLLDVDGRDDLDPTHISIAHQDFLRSLFVLHGCQRRADLEERLDWGKKNRVLVYEVPRD